MSKDFIDKDKVDKIEAIAYRRFNDGNKRSY